MTRVVETHPVLAEVASRMSGRPNEGIRLALAVEGGGIRGVVSAGMLSALHTEGIESSVFDAVFAVSAGALNSALYVAGRVDDLGDLYAAVATDKKAIDWRRIFLGRPLLDLDYVVDHLFANAMSDNLGKVLTARSLRVLATSVDRGKAVAFPVPQDWSELAEYLKSSMALPVVAGGPRRVRGERYFDAGLAEDIPSETPLREGFTHVLALSTRRLGSVPQRTIRRELVRKIWMYRYGPELRRLARDRRASEKERADRLVHRTSDPGSEGPYVFMIAPDGSHPPIQPFDVRPDEIKAASKFGFDAARAALRAATTGRSN